MDRIPRELEREPAGTTLAVRPPAHEQPLGELLRGIGPIGDEDIARIVALQAERGLRFGEAALALGLVQPAQLQQALARQFGYACVDAAQHPHLAELSVATDPHGECAELWRDLRAQLMLRVPEDVTRRPLALAIVSPERGDGRTHAAANLAVAFSQLGERTVLVDADLRSPRLHRLFALPARPGLSALLADPGFDLESDPGLDRIDPLPSLQVLQVGAPPPNPLELLQRGRFGALLEVLARRFDRIVVDTPPACDGADARVIATACGQALVLARRHRSRAADLRTLVDALRRESVDLAGVVVNGT
ncbi:hypothetical protein [Sphaerotilus uruguayifluvii]|uniref:Receptor protein-tyrosine kinase n=1 Tax=Sphaerotilus uruguayifluvii TaxID=2735897 RepID=A0ABX2FWX2_9BURK|nr:hypothetical protein [Leptothrix sp. C29]NRT54467.1 receptor protein-tyrosine kinase [Leptothrix sp. C29]